MPAQTLEFRPNDGFPSLCWKTRSVMNSLIAAKLRITRALDNNAFDVKANSATTLDRLLLSLLSAIDFPLSDESDRRLEYSLEDSSCELHQNLTDEGLPDCSALDLGFGSASNSTTCGAKFLNPRYVRFVCGRCMPSRFSTRALSSATIWKRVCSNQVSCHNRCDTKICPRCKRSKFTDLR
jgi:hypothetical protein